MVYPGTDIRAIFNMASSLDREPAYSLSFDQEMFRDDPKYRLKVALVFGAMNNEIAHVFGKLPQLRGAHHKFSAFESRLVEYLSKNKQ